MSTKSKIYFRAEINQRLDDVLIDETLRANDLGKLAAFFYLEDDAIYDGIKYKIDGYVHDYVCEVYETLLQCSSSEELEPLYQDAVKIALAKLVANYKKD